MSTSEINEELELQLGDIIEITAPDNVDINGMSFFVEYIDKSLIKLLNIENNKKISIPIESGNLIDPSIKQISLLDRAESPSYTKQNNLYPGTWINIKFNLLDDSFDINGLIINVDEDQITVKTYPENESIFIDFAYKGIPEDLPIEKITIISNPTIPDKVLPSEQPRELSEQFTEDLELPIDSSEQFPEELEEIKELKDLKTKLSETLDEADEIEFGDDLEEIEIFEEVDEAFKRYSLEKQIDDLLSDLLSKIPIQNRTDKLINETHKVIERFIQLREKYSFFDENGNANIPLEVSEYNSLIDVLLKLDKNINYLLPVAINKNKLYNRTSAFIGEADNIDNIDEERILFREEELGDDFRKGSSQIDESRYVLYYKLINNIYTPFSSPSEISETIFHNNVKTNILAILNNIGNFETVVAEKFVKSKDDSGGTDKIKFYNEMYNLPLEYSSSQGKKNISKSDDIFIQGLIFPNRFLLFNQLKYEITTNFLQKIYLNNNNIRLNKYLNNNSILNNITIDSLDSEDERFKFFKENFLKTKASYLLDYDLMNNNIETYKKFLQTIIPSDSQFFEQYKNNLVNLYSKEKIINRLNIFNIYHDKISFELSNQIERLLKENSSNYIESLSKTVKEYKTQFKYVSYFKTNYWLNLLSAHESLYKIILNEYNLDKDIYYSNSELLTIVNNVDNGNLFILAILKINIDLNSTGLIEDYIAKYKSQIESLEYPNTICKIISNRYFSLDDLIYSNDREIFFDSEFDKTEYKFPNKFKKQKEDLSETQFRDLLIDNYKSKKQLTREESVYEVDNMLTNKRRVREGDYAILDIGGGTLEYYIRNENKWVKDTNLTGKIEIKDNKLFCNLQESCIDVNNNCESLLVAQDKTEDQILKEIYKEFEENYDEDSSSLKEEIDQKLINSINYTKLLKKLKKQEFFKYDKEKILITDSLNVREITNLSPYLDIRDKVLGIDDFVKKQNFIQKFTVLFTRPPISNENQYWLYCNKTDTPLLPMFVSHLANVFISGGDYVYELDLIAENQGAISDDGNAFVDKYSGFFIKNIDFNTEEGYTEEGFKLKTRDKLEKDLGDAVLEMLSPSDQDTSKLTKEEQSILNIIKTITGPNGMMINLENEHEFIINNVIRLYSKIIPSPEAYAQLEKKLASQQKKAPLYQELLDTPLLQLTLIFILIAIQISIPSINSRKTFPGCVKSFKGYPIYNDSKEAINYLCCVAVKMKSSIPPWYTLSTMKTTKLVEKLEKLIEKYKILDNQYVKDRVNQKLIYLADDKNEEIVVDKEIVLVLNQFLPPLFKINVKPLPLASDFPETFKSYILSKNKEQIELFNSIKSKAFQFGLEIQTLINDIVTKNVPLISSKAGQLFLQNACCNTLSSNIYNYIVEQNPLIKQNNDLVINIQGFIKEINQLDRAALLFDPTNTKQVWPEIGKIFSKDTIYRAFIVYCRNRKLQLNKEIRDVCQLGELSPLIEDTTDEIIEVLKSRGIDYDESLLEQLIQLVNLKNIIKLDLKISFPTKLQNLEKLLTRLKDDNNGIDEEFILKFYDLIDTFDIRHKDGNPTVRELKNYLGLNISRLLEKIKQFIKANSKISKSKFLNFIECLDNIIEFKASTNSSTFNAEDEAIFKMMDFIENISHNIVNVFPFIVKNGLNFTDIKIPKHWDLSMKHTKDIKDIVTNYYKNLKQFSGNESFINIIKTIPEKCKIFKEFINNTPYFAKYNDVSSIFDERLIKQLFFYYFLNILNIHIESSKKLDERQYVPTSIGEEILEQVEIPDLEKEKSEEERKFDAVVATGTLNENQKQISEYLVSIMEIICDDKDFINFTNSDIDRKILIAKEKEKDNITEYLQNLTDDERNVEKLFKKHKLEKWGKGLQKGLTQYVKDNYDEERDALEAQEIKDKQLAKLKGVEQSNINIYQLELDADTLLAEEIEREEYSLEDYEGEDGPQEYDEFDYED